MRTHILQALALVAALNLTGCATSAGGTNSTVERKSRGTLRVSPELENDREVAERLRAVTARVRRGEGEALRATLLLEAEQRPSDLVVQLQLAWMRAPSEQGWQDLKRLSNYNATNPWPYWAMGAIYLQWGDFADQAALEFERALTLRRGFVPALVGKADVLRQKGLLEEAKEAYEELLAVVPDWVEAQRGLGLTWLALGDEARGREALEQVLAADPDDFESLTALAKLARKENDAASAVRHYRQLLTFTPKDRALRMELAQLLEKTGELPAAIVEYEAAAKLGVDRALLESLVRLHAAQKQTEKEADALERLADIDKRDAAPLIRIAELRRAEGDDAGAETALRLAAERRPDDSALLLTIARLVRQRDDLVAAIEAFRTAKQKGASEAESELAELESKAGLEGKPAVGDVNRIYVEVSRRLDRLYEEVKKEKPKLAGTIKAQVSVGADGLVTGVDVIEDTVRDPSVLANVYFNLKDAQFPKAKRTPTFEFVLGRR